MPPRRDAPSRIGIGALEKAWRIVLRGWDRAACIAGKEFYQGRLPAWLRRTGNGRNARAREIEVIEDRAATVRYIYAMAAQGLGYSRILKRLMDEKVPTFVSRTPHLGENGETPRPA